MRDKTFSSLLLFSLFGITMWFFGNLYEGIVIGPNMVTDTAQRMHYWQNFFVTTNPVFFYIPLPPLATIVLVGLYIKTAKLKVKLKQQLKMAAISQLISIALSAYIITQINLPLFFGNLEASKADKIHSMALDWNILNAVRIVLVAVALTFTFKAYLEQIKKT